jgi:hypothetical protein
MRRLASASSLSARSAKAGERELLVGALGEALTREAREGVGVVDRHLDVIGVHVRESRRLVPRARPEVLVDRRQVRLLVVRDADRRVQQTGGHHEVVEQPEVAPVAVVHAALEGELAATEVEARLLA